jgi:hypothetical protein
METLCRAEILLMGYLDTQDLAIRVRGRESSKRPSVLALIGARKVRELTGDPCRIS